MTRKIISKKDRIDEIKEILDAETVKPMDAEQFTSAIKEKAGGSISGLVVHTEAHGQWLTALQEKNPFIGKKYMTRAVEYETESKATATENQKVADADAALLAQLDSGLAPYDPNADFGDIAVERKEKRDTGNAQQKMIDHCIVSNVTKKLIGRSSDEIKEIAKTELENYHGDSEYESEINIDQSIEYTQQTLLLTQSEPNKKLK